jgi:hypothetical protein
MKKCSQCGKKKKSSEFYACKTLKGGLHGTCKLCHRANTKSYEHRTPGRRLGKNLRRKYWPDNSWKDALAIYNSMLKKQDGVCAVCKQPERKTAFGKLRTLSVDHCHQTGKIRALLCDACNIAEGLLKKPEVAQALARYMGKHS